jgi:hypothetical protein
MPIMTRRSGIRPAAASCVYSIKNPNIIFLSRIHPKYSGFHSYFIQKRSIYERFEEFVYPQEINLKAQQNVQN